MIRSGMGDGGTERFYKDEAGTMMVEYKGGVAGKEGFTVVAEDFFNYMPETVPDDKADLTSRLQKSNVITKDLTVSPTFREKQNGEDVVRSDIDRNSQSLVSFSPLNTQQLATSSATISQALAANRLMSVAAQNSYTQNVLPFLKSRGITQGDGSDWPKELETGDGINGKSFYSVDSIKIYKKALIAYTENMFGLNKTNQVISTTKLTDSEFKRRLGITDDKPEVTQLEKTALEVIDKIEIPTAQGVGPAEEDSQFLDMQALEKAVAPYGFNVKSALEVGGTGGFTLSKNVEGADRTVTIFETMSEKEIKDLMKFIETGQQVQAPILPGMPKQ